MARRFARPTVKVATFTTPTETGGLSLVRPNLVKLARQAGLGTIHRGVPPRENPAFDAMRKHGAPAPGSDRPTFESLFNEPATWYAPPESLTIDVDRTIREGKFHPRHAVIELGRAPAQPGLSQAPEILVA
jgi:hypothetical protein